MDNPPPPRIAELSPDQEDIGLRLVLGGLAESQFLQEVAMLRALVQRQPLSGYRVWGAFRAEEMTGSLLIQTQPGRTAVIWPPQIVAGEPQETVCQLLRAGLKHLPQLGIRMVQALLPTDVGADAKSLVAVGFRYLSDLLYLVCLADEFPTSPPCLKLQFEPYAPTRHARFAELVDATYKDSLDCPAVNGVRSVDDVLQGYRATGHFDPERWFIIHHQSEEIGCLILTDYPENAIWELIYMGLLPTARGRGLGVEIVRHALWLAGQASRNRLVLAVDAANGPALRMYAAAGFQAWDRKSVYILVLNENGSMVK
ncbi:MAG: GNAT family N-acetyltransferase [Planctomycetota bacterium]